MQTFQKPHGVFVFNSKHSTKNSRFLWTVCSTTWRHIPEDFEIPRNKHWENIRLHNAELLFAFGVKPPPPLVGHDLLLHEVHRSHTTTYHTRYNSSGRVISSSQRPLPDKTWYSKGTTIHATGGIRTTQHVIGCRPQPLTAQRNAELLMKNKLHVRN
jgi:hypothetical protein